MKQTYAWEFNTIQQALKKFIGLERINDESIDFKWGYFSPKFGFEFIVNRGFYFDQRYSISLCLGWGKLTIWLPIKTSMPEFHDWQQYGIKIHGNTLWIKHGEYERNQDTKNYIAWDLPFFNYIHDFHKVKNIHGEWVDYQWRAEDTYKETHDYKYTLRNGDIQNVKATCTVRKMQWHRKWFPFLKMIKETIDINFDSEVGERSGSWKGGVTGCGYDILKGESIEQCLRRMELERRFT